MNDFGEMSATGVVLSNSEMKERRLKRGECVTCGIKCFKKTLFKSIPISDHGKVLNGRCLQCRPLDVHEMTVLPAQVEIASEKDLRRANNSLSSRQKLESSFRKLQNKASLRNLGKKRGSGASSVASSNSLSVALDTKSDSSACSDARNAVMREEACTPVLDPENSQAIDVNADTIPQTKPAPMKQSKVKVDMELRKCENALESALLTNEGGVDRSLEYIEDDSLILDQNEGRKIIEAVDLLADNKPTSLIEILEVAQKFPSNFCVREAAIQALCEFIMHTKLVETDFDLLVNNGGIKLLVSGLKEHTEDDALLTSVCSALGHIITSAQIQKSLADHDAVPYIIKLFDIFPNCENLIFSCIECLGEVCSEHTNSCRLEELGGEKRIVEAMALHSDSLDFQEICIDTIIKLSRKDSLRSAILAANGADQVSISMVIFSNNTMLLERALRALRTFSEGRNSDNAKRVASSGAIDSIVSAMHLHRDDKIIQSSAAWALGKIGTDMDSAKCVGECGGIDVTTRAIFAHSEDQVVASKGCRALEILSKYDGNRDLMVEIGVLNAVLRVMQHQTDQVSTISSCFKVLSNLCRNDVEVKIKIVQNESLDSISMLMVIHANDRALQKRACSILCNLVCEENLESLLAIGVSELLTEASKEFPEDCMKYAKQAMSLIENMQ